eukprot:1554275-Pleurochrysis_carterae.AAC.1
MKVSYDFARTAVAQVGAHQGRACLLNIINAERLKYMCARRPFCDCLLAWEVWPRQRRGASIAVSEACS